MSKQSQNNNQKIQQFKDSYTQKEQILCIEQLKQILKYSGNIYVKPKSVKYSLGLNRSYMEDLKALAEALPLISQKQMKQLCQSQEAKVYQKVQENQKSDLYAEMSMVNPDLQILNLSFGEMSQQWKSLQKKITKQIEDRIKREKSSTLLKKRKQEENVVEDLDSEIIKDIKRDNKAQPQIYQQCGCHSQQQQSHQSQIFKENDLQKTQKKRGLRDITNIHQNVQVDKFKIDNNQKTQQLPQQQQGQVEMTPQKPKKSYFSNYSCSHNRLQNEENRNAAIYRSPACQNSLQFGKNLNLRNIMNNNNTNQKQNNQQQQQTLQQQQSSSGEKNVDDLSEEELANKFFKKLNDLGSQKTSFFNQGLSDKKGFMSNNKNKYNFHLSNNKLSHQKAKAFCFSYENSPAEKFDEHSQQKNNFFYQQQYNSHSSYKLQNPFTLSAQRKEFSDCSKMHNFFEEFESATKEAPTTAATYNHQNQGPIIAGLNTNNYPQMQYCNGGSACMGCIQQQQQQQQGCSSYNGLQSLRYHSNTFGGYHGHSHSHQQSHSQAHHQQQSYYGSNVNQKIDSSHHGNSIFQDSCSKTRDGQQQQWSIWQEYDTLNDPFGDNKILEFN